MNVTKSPASARVITVSAPWLYPPVTVSVRSPPSVLSETVPIIPTLSGWASVRASAVVVTTEQTSPQYVSNLMVPPLPGSLSSPGPMFGVNASNMVDNNL